MYTLLAGLLLVLGMHSVRVVAEPLRSTAIARLGLQGWRGIYSLVSLAGIWLVVSGYAGVRLDSPDLYHPPAWAHTVALGLMLVSLVLLSATYVPGTHIRQWVAHPMLLGTRVWAFAHLLANGRLADVVLFGSVLGWSIFAYHAARARDAASATRYPANGWPRDAIAVVAGVVLWMAVVVYLHRYLAGVPLMAAA
jgi:uncharacterized membrane protein